MLDWPKVFVPKDLKMNAGKLISFSAFWCPVRLQKLKHVTFSSDEIAKHLKFAVG